MKAQFVNQFIAHSIKFNSDNDACDPQKFVGDSLIDVWVAYTTRDLPGSDSNDSSKVVDQSAAFVTETNSLISLRKSAEFAFEDVSTFNDVVS
jgi:hypothetical protein